MEPSRDSQLLGQFLSDRDIGCPACGYNLRGSSAPRCGECGAAVQLSLARAGALGGQWWFFVFAFGWAFMYNALSLARQVWWVETLAQVRSGPVSMTYTWDRVPTVE
jgi:hypothetical protein